MAEVCLDGFWYCEGDNNISEIKGNEGQTRQLWELDMNPQKEGKKFTLKFGKFQETVQEIRDKTGAFHYNFEMQVDFLGQMVSVYGVVSPDGKSICLNDPMNDRIRMMNWLSSQKKQELFETRLNQDELIPPGFTPQPQNQGKIIFICGPPGAGKSTTAQSLARQMGWIYYEADCYTQCLDPFVPLDEKEPSVIQMHTGVNNYKIKESFF